MWAEILFKLQWQIEKPFLELRLGPWLNSTSPLNNNNRLYNYPAIQILVMATKKDREFELPVLLQLMIF